MFTLWKWIWNNCDGLLLGYDIGKASFCEWEEAYCTRENSAGPGNLFVCFLVPFEVILGCWMGLISSCSLLPTDTKQVG